MAETTLNSFEDITGRMDEIIAAVRSKDTSLERSLDLFDEAIALGSHAVELVDSFDLSPSETAQLEASEAGGEPDASAPAPDAAAGKELQASEPGCGER
ncbi:exodeoxyribonuclease VII small subunit [uncultured Enorma sp.]|uniref:exodeoxyribonuclease VII small subunit n=1 Tax=uncultured Enorma sp. TaxID=1714346 RepID=UPI00259364A6|nr:exodeoxyribonuclease VII small subunit [uncultured Enorma sp.]